jgi:L-2-hydroxyglutarate oxidase LhgO
MGERVEDYSVAEARGAAFCEAARRFLPELRAADLVPAYSGLRPQRDSEGFRDFYIEHEAGAGAPGWVNLVGIESPGLTAALAIGRDVADRLS